MDGLHRPSFGELQFEIRKHWATRFHYDLRLQWKRVLLDWAMPYGLSCRVGQAFEAFEMEDHRAKDLLFEGIQPTGTVMIWDRGSWKPHRDESAALISLKRGDLEFSLHGERVHGCYALTRRSAATRTRPATWNLLKVSDLSAENPAYEDALERWPNSVLRGGRNKEQIESDWLGSRPKQPSLFDAAAVPAMPSDIRGADDATVKYAVVATQQLLFA